MRAPSQEFLGGSAGEGTEKSNPAGTLTCSRSKIGKIVRPNMLQGVTRGQCANIGIESNLFQILPRLNHQVFCERSAIVTRTCAFFVFRRTGMNWGALIPKHHIGSLYTVHLRKSFAVGAMMAVRFGKPTPCHGKSSLLYVCVYIYIYIYC